MTTLVSTLIDDTHRELHGIQQGKFNFVSGNVLSGDTTITFGLAMNGIAAGATVGIEQEIVFVKSASGQVATVSRGWLGTTAAAHSSGTMAEVQPRFPRYQILKALRDEIQSWPDSLYQIATVQLSGSTTTRAYNLTGVTDFHRIIEVRRSPYSTSTSWPVVRNYTVDRYANASDFTSGVALFVGEDFSEAVDLRVTYAAPFDLLTFDETTDVQNDVGLANSMLDIPVLGAAWRLLAPREAKRTFTEAQSEPRLSEEVPPGSTIRAAAGLKMLRDQRIDEEAARLAKKTPLHW